jgi:hypothetical protein
VILEPDEVETLDRIEHEWWGDPNRTIRQLLEWGYLEGRQHGDDKRRRLQLPAAD